jgi:drug/metabolite transporter (DMT)-like permease
MFFKKSGETVHPIALNLFKNSLAVVLFIPTMVIFGEPFYRDVPLNDYLIVLASGALGIGISDTMFFKSLNLLGAGMSAIVDCLYSPFIIGLSILMLGESLNLIQVIGVIMILSAVLTATHPKGRGNISKPDLIRGIIWGVLAMAVMAVGIVMVKPVLDRSPLLWVTEYRLFGGAVVLLIILLFHPRRKKIIGSLFSMKSWRYTISGSFFGAYLAMLIWLAGMKYTQASTAAALNQTSNIFIFIFAAIFLKEAINTQKTIAIIIAVGGAFMVTFG